MEACERLSMGENVDEQLRALVEGYGSGVDTPVSDVYIELARVFPEAKVCMIEETKALDQGTNRLRPCQVVLTHRPADEWHTSYVNMAKHLGGLYALWVYWNPEVSESKSPSSLDSQSDSYGEMYTTDTCSVSDTLVCVYSP